MNVEVYTISNGKVDIEIYYCLNMGKQIQTNRTRPKYSVTDT